MRALNKDEESYEGCEKEEGGVEDEAAEPRLAGRLPTGRLIGRQSGVDNTGCTTMEGGGGGSRHQRSGRPAGGGGAAGAARGEACGGGGVGGGSGGDG